MNILEKIIQEKKKDIKLKQQKIPLAKLKESSLYTRKTISLQQAIAKNPTVGLIAEIKRSSPSTGVFHKTIDVEQLAVAYQNSGASALSVLTDFPFFKGSLQDLRMARKNVTIPILRKDFIIDTYQIHEAKSNGADCILLIAACLTSKNCEKLAKVAKNLQLEVLLEVHNKIEIQSHVNKYIDIIGINNRDLTNFTTSIQNSIDLYPYLPKTLPKISESGIYNASQMYLLKQVGFNGFLIGGYFMKQNNPAKACQQLLEDFKNESL